MPGHAGQSRAVCVPRQAPLPCPPNHSSLSAFPARPRHRPNLLTWHADRAAQEVAHRNRACPCATSSAVALAHSLARPSMVAAAAAACAALLTLVPATRLAPAASASASASACAASCLLCSSPVQALGHGRGVCHGLSQHHAVRPAPAPSGAIQQGCSAGLSSGAGLFSGAASETISCMAPLQPWRSSTGGQPTQPDFLASP